MLVKVKAHKPWAKFEQVFEDPIRAEETASNLELDGWTVEWIPLGNVTLEEYCNAAVMECYIQLDLLFGPIDSTCH